MTAVVSGNYSQICHQADREWWPSLGRRQSRGWDIAYLSVINCLIGGRKCSWDMSLHSQLDSESSSAWLSPLLAECRAASAHFLVDSSRFTSGKQRPQISFGSLWLGLQQSRARPRNENTLSESVMTLHHNSLCLEFPCWWSWMTLSGYFQGYVLTQGTATWSLQVVTLHWSSIPAILHIFPNQT